MARKIFFFVMIALVLGLMLYRQYSQRQAGTDGPELPGWQTGMDVMDVYGLRMAGEPVFTTLDSFTGAFGLPWQAKFGTETFDISSPADLDRLVEQAEETGYELYLDYEGLEMNYFTGDGRLVISSIDLRKAGTGLDYEGRTFDRDFTFTDFRGLFPVSSSMDLASLTGDVELPGISSLFGLNTGENTEGTKSYMVERRSVDDPYASPVVEFTFRDGKLIYIFFANF